MLLIQPQVARWSRVGVGHSVSTTFICFDIYPLDDCVEHLLDKMSKVIIELVYDRNTNPQDIPQDRVNAVRYFINTVFIE